MIAVDLPFMIIRRVPKSQHVEQCHLDAQENCSRDELDDQREDFGDQGQDFGDPRKYLGDQKYFQQKYF